MSADPKPTSTAVAVHDEPNNQLAGFAIQAANMDQAMKVCEWLAKSPLIPKAYQGNPQAIWTAGAMGQKLGLDLFTSMMGIASINGRPCVWGDVLRGKILSSSLLESLTEDFEGKGDALTAVCTITRKGLPAYTARFGVPDAKAAGLLGRDTWKNYTPDMLANRAFGRAARRRFADVLCGMHVGEEMEDAQVVDVTASATVRAEPKPAKRRTVNAETETHSGVTSQGTTSAPGRETAEDRAEDAQQFGDQKPAEEKTLGEHLAQTQSAEQPAQHAAKDTSVATCTREFEKLWKHSDAGKARAKAIQASWNLKMIADLAGAADGDREAFLIEVENAQKAGV